MALAVACGLAVPGVVSAQAVYPPLRINPRPPGDTTPYYGGAIDGALFPRSEVVAATTKGGSPTEVLYAIIFNLGADFPYTGTLTVPPNSDNPALAHPAVRFTQSAGIRQFWLGASGVKPDATTGVYVAKRDLDTFEFEDAVTAVEHSAALPAVSRPVFPAFPFDADLYVSYVESLGGCCSGCPAEPPSAFGRRSPDFGQNWSGFQVKPPVPPTPCDYRGRGPAVVTGTGNALIVAAADVDVRTLGAPDPDWLNNEGRPFVTRSTDQGASWTQQPITIGEGFGIAPPQPGDAIAIDGGEFLPYIAIRRRNNAPDIVHVLFAARETPESGDLDLYLATSFDAGATFENQDILHLTDIKLHGIDALPEGPDQIPAGLAVDSCGGVHILWYDTFGTSPTPPEVDLHVYWAFIDETQIGLPDPQIVVERLTTQAFTAGTMASPVFLGERQGLATVQRGFGGLWVYACYAMVEEGLVNTYVSRVHWGNVCTTGGMITASADFNADGQVSGDDAAFYTAAWAAGDPAAADMTDDGEVGADDLLIYFDIYEQATSGNE